MAYEWADYFRDLLKGRGYDNPSISHDPAYGWTVLYDPEQNGEFEAQTTAAVQRRIAALPMRLEA